MSDEVLTSVQSLRQADRILRELAVQGKMTASGYNELDAVFTSVDGSTEMFISKKAERQYQVVKRVKEKNVA